MRHTTARKTFSWAGTVVILALGGAYGCGSEMADAGSDGTGSTGNDGNDGTGGFGFPNDSPNDGNDDGQGPTGNPSYQPNFIERGRPPGPPERGYSAVEPELSGGGEGEFCAVCADSADCAAGACVVHMDTGETFCAVECTDDLDCADPQTEECVAAEGADSAQCVPRLGTCYEFEPDAEPINPINEPPEDTGQGGSAGSSN